MIPSSFDRKNERLLQVVLHYLLLILDTDSFLAAITQCWPCLDYKEKNLYYTAVHESVTRLVQKNVIPGNVYKSSLLSMAAGEEIWNLLKSLSDACLDQMISTLIAEAETDETTTPKDQRARNIEDKDDLLKAVEEEFHALRATLLQMRNERREWHDYIVELDDRMTNARKQAIKLETQMKEQLQGEEQEVLSEHGQWIRDQVLIKIASQIELLKQFCSADMPLLAEVDAHLADDKEEFEEQGQLAATSSSSVSRALTRPKSSKKSSNKQRTTIEQLEQQKINIQRSLDDLITRINAVCDKLSA